MLSRYMLKKFVADAVARGWCADSTENKVFDATLATAIANSVLDTLGSLAVAEKEMEKFDQDAWEDTKREQMKIVEHALAEAELAAYKEEQEYAMRDAHIQRWVDEMDKITYNTPSSGKCQ